MAAAPTVTCLGPGPVRVGGPPPGAVRRPIGAGRLVYCGPKARPQVIFAHQNSSWTFGDKDGSAGTGEATTWRITVGDRLTVPSDSVLTG